MGQLNLTKVVFLSILDAYLHVKNKNVNLIPPWSIAQ